MSAPDPIKPAVALLDAFIQHSPEDFTSRLEQCKTAEVIEILSQLPEKDLGVLFNRFTPQLSAELLEEMEEDLLERSLSSMDIEKAARSLSWLSEEKSEACLKLLSSEQKTEVEELRSYPPDSAGQLMDPRVDSCRDSLQAGEALTKIRNLRKGKKTQIVYVTNESDILLGYVTLIDIALAPPDTPLSELPLQSSGNVKAVEPKDEALKLFEEKSLPTVPVVDYEGKLLGVIRYDTLMSFAQEGALEDIQSMVGASPDERALSPVMFSVRKRLPWLQINLVTAFLAAAVVGLFENTIAQVTALAVLLPVVAGQSGNTGAQALAVTIRGLTLKEVRISQWFRLVRKEMLAGFVNGCAVAVVTAAGVWFWSGNIGLVMVIGVSMVFSMMMAGAAGAAIPLILKAFKQDPAQSSSIVLTTITDVVGFFSFLGLATLFMSMLPQG